MNTVYICKFFDFDEDRVAATKEKAYQICREYINDTVRDHDERNGCLKELSIDYLEYPDSFGCEGICWAIKTEVE